MVNGLKVTVGPKNFSEKNTDEKLELIYQAVTSQQTICVYNVDSFKAKLDKYDKHIEGTLNLPKRDRKVGLGVGVGSGAVCGYSIPGIIDYIKNLFSGVN